MYMRVSSNEGITSTIIGRIELFPTRYDYLNDKNNTEENGYAFDYFPKSFLSFLFVIAVGGVE